MNQAFFKAVFSETFIYVLCVTAYFFSVLHFLGDWLNDLFKEHRHWYAALAVLLIAGQGFGLDFLAGSLVKHFRPEQKKKE